jgi:hypothetical protein
MNFALIELLGKSILVYTAAFFAWRSNSKRDIHNKTKCVSRKIRNAFFISMIGAFSL